VAEVYRYISDFAIVSPKFLAMLGTSDMPRTLSEIGQSGGFIFKNNIISYRGKKW